MKINHIKLHDLHVHTNLSLCCEDLDATIENYLKLAKEIGIETLGITDHMWDIAHIPTENQWYAKQSFERQLGRRHEFSEKINGIRLLWGCETEYAGGVLGITPECAKKLDYVLIPHSHFHMKGFVRPAEINTPELVARLMIATFKDVVNTGIATGIAHPFDPCFMYDRITELFSYLSDKDFEECFALAKQKEVSIEINISSFHNNIQAGPFSDCYFRMFEIAKRVGCKFHFGSDTHSLNYIDYSSSIKYVINRLKLTPDNILDIINR